MAAMRRLAAGSAAGIIATAFAQAPLKGSG